MDEGIIIQTFNMFFPDLRIQKVLPIDGGLSRAKKYKVEAVKSDFLVKVLPGRVDNKIYEALRLKHSRNGCLVASKAWRHFGLKRKTVLIQDWISGESLEGILFGADEILKRRYGREAAELLRTLHEEEFTPVPGAAFKEFNRYRSYLNRHNVDYEHRDEIEGYVLERKNYYRFCPRRALVHQDFRPENLILHDGRLYLIDFETAALGDPYNDFPFCLSFQPQEFLPYSTELILSYFNGKIPVDFWEWSCFYNILALQKYAIWKHKRKKGKVRLQAEHLFCLYSGMRTNVPLFWRE